MKGLFKKLAVTAVLSAMTFGFLAGNAEAAIYTFNPIQDLEVNHTIGSYSGENMTDITVYNQNPYYDSYSNAYLKFDLNSDINGKTANPLTEKVVSAKLMMYSNWFDAHEGTEFYLNFFRSNNWDETLTGPILPGNVFETTEREYITSFKLPGDFFGGWVTWDMLVNELTPQDYLFMQNYLLHTNNIISFEVAAESGYEFASFQSRENIYAPQLIIETVPTPEPSSILLSVMGIAGAMRLRKKK